MKHDTILNKTMQTQLAVIGAVLLLVTLLKSLSHTMIRRRLAKPRWFDV